MIAPDGYDFVTSESSQEQVSSDKKGRNITNKWNFYSDGEFRKSKVIGNMDNFLRKSNEVIAREIKIK